METQYRAIDGYPGYRVGSDGSVWSCKTKGGRLSDRWRQLKIVVGRDGYAQVSLCHASRTIVRHVHRLVLDAFVGARPKDMVCCHADGNRLNNCLYNLRWDSYVNNEKDKDLHGRKILGEKSYGARLSGELIRSARQLRQSGWTYQKIADHIGCGRNTIRRALVGESWTHL